MTLAITSVEYLPADIRARASRIRDYRRYREAGVGICESARRAWKDEGVDEPCGKLFADALTCAIDLADELDRRESLAAEQALPVEREWLLTLPGAHLDPENNVSPESERLVVIPCGKFSLIYDNDEPHEITIDIGRYLGPLRLAISTRGCFLDMMRVFILGSGAANG